MTKIVCFQFVFHSILLSMTSLLALNA